MDKRTKRYFIIGIILSALLLIIFFAYNIYTYGEIFPGTYIPVTIGVVIGIFGSYVLYHSFNEREQEMYFSPGEQVYMKRILPDKCVIIPHSVVGGTTIDSSPMDVNLYLTSVGIAAEPPGLGEPILYIGYNDIQEMKIINRMMARYIQLRYIDVNNMLAEILLFVGDETDKWAEKIGGMMVS